MRGRKRSLGQFGPTDDWGLDLTLDFDDDMSFSSGGESIDDMEPNNIPESESASAAGPEGVVTGPPSVPAVAPKKSEFPMGLLVVAGIAAYLLMKR